MDPLSITASTIAVIQLCSKVVKFISAASGATKERKRLGDEVRACEFLLQQLRDDAGGDSDDAQSWSETIKALEAPDGPLGRLWTALSLLKANLEPKKGLKKALTAIKWPFDEDEVQKIIAAIEREKLLLEVALTNNCRKLTVDIKKSLRENTARLEELFKALEESKRQNLRHAVKFEDVLSSIQKSATDMTTGIEKLNQAEDRKQRMVILNWLAPIDYAPQHSDYIRRRQAGTGQWLLQTEEFSQWVETKQETLFCHGIPGTGKTILTAIVVDHLRKKFMDDKKVAVTYLYFNFRRHHEQKLEDLLLSLVKQLAQDCTVFPESVNYIYYDHTEKRTRPLLDEITHLLESVVLLYSRVFILIDALDECQTTNSCCAKFLGELFKLQEKYGVNIFATSRPIPEITEAFSGKPQLEIRATKEDIRAYLDHHMSPRRAFLRKNRALQEEIKTVIVTAVNGIEDDIRNALEDLPQGSEVYDEAYKDAMKRINAQDKDGERLAKQVLSWIVYARRPLSTAELQHALAVRVGDSRLNKKRQSDIEDMVSVCAGLVTIDEQSNIIRLVHLTTQKYFERTRMTWFPNAETEIADVCVTYLSFDDFDHGVCFSDSSFEERLRENQLYDYACHNWGNHSRWAASSIPRVLEFLNSRNKVEASVQCSTVARYQLFSSGYSQQYLKRATGLHVAAHFGLQDEMKVLIDQEDNLNPKDSRGQTPLLWAAANGHAAIVNLLLEEGADMKLADFVGRTPLSRASANGHQKVVEILLKKDSNTELRDRKGMTSLLWATLHGRGAIVELLLRNNADIESTDTRGRSPLSWAARTGSESVVRILLANGADLELEDDYGQTPLSWAARTGHVGISRMLLSKGAMPDAKDGQYGRTPLSWAVWNGQKAIAEMLLDNGADIESRDSWDNRTSLSWAARDGWHTIVDLLLDRGANIESKDDYGWTATSWAAKAGFIGVLQSLTDRGANIESRDNRGQTPLCLAAGNNRCIVIQALLDIGAKIESKDDYGQTAFSHAAANGQEAAMKLLLQHGAEVETRDGNGQTPLSWAARNGQINAVDWLLDHNVDVETADLEGLTPLLWAARNDCEAVMALLGTETAKTSDQEKIKTWKSHHAIVRLGPGP